MTSHGPFQLDQWWDRESDRHNCVIHLGRPHVEKHMSVHEYSSEPDGYYAAQVKAWREMALRLAQLQEITVPMSPPMSMGITP